LGGVSLNGCSNNGKDIGRFPLIDLFDKNKTRTYHHHTKPSRPVPAIIFTNITLANT